MIKRAIYQQLLNNIHTRRALVLFGPRQVGKTTILRQLVADMPRQDYLWFSGDDLEHRELLTDISIREAERQFTSRKIIVIDEAQRVRNIGLTIKIIVDNIPGAQVIASGSSSFDLANQINEPLTGRKTDFWLFPFSYGELALHNSDIAERNSLAARLIYGTYPAVINSPGNERETLKTLANEYLYRDAFALQELRKPELLINLLKALALQMGNQVSFAELGKTLKVSSPTVERYIQLLEQAFIIFRLGAFSRNLRTELSKTRKIYFYDCGIRNALIGNFSNLADRNDVGALWENYLVSERKKYIEYNRIWNSSYFWRNTNQQEIDYIEEQDGQLAAYEFTFSEKKAKKIPGVFIDAYAPKQTRVINRKNYYAWLTGE